MYVLMYVFLYVHVEISLDLEDFSEMKKKKKKKKKVFDMDGMESALPVSCLVSCFTKLLYVFDNAL